MLYISSKRDSLMLYSILPARLADACTSGRLSSIPYGTVPYDANHRTEKKSRVVSTAARCMHRPSIDHARCSLVLLVQ